MNQFARPGLAVTELPPVNADDNGKVLGVSDGAWAKVAASGGSDLPDDPAQDGTYNLQNTVSSGTGTLSWASGSSGGGVLVVNVDMQTRTLDKTWKEISDAPFAVVRFPHPEMSGTAIAYNPITYIISGSTYKVRFNDPAYGVTEFTTDSEDGYPSFSE